MANYRRNYIEGGIYFFTLTMSDRKSSLLVDEVELLRKSFKRVQQELPFNIDAIVILPEHLHCVWTLPLGDFDYSTRWKKIKAGFSRCLPKAEKRRESQIKKGESGIWQRRFWEHTLRDEEDFLRHVEYIHYNPVKHGYVRSVREWPYSSFHRYVRDGRYPADWADYPDNEAGCFGE
ncbi:MAG: transposase [Thermodesulfobacteriota bacterium]